MRELLARNLASLEERIERACERAGRARGEIRLIAVTKTVSVEVIKELAGLGIRDLAENRPQQLRTRILELSDLDVTWHMIGHLQRNKVRGIAPLADWVHSVDSVRLLQELMAEPGSSQLLIQLNLSGEQTKGGFSEEQFRSSWKQIRELAGDRVQGLMTMAPAEDPLHPPLLVFSRLKALSQEFQLPECSMGMSGDFEEAIAAGATMIRVGSALFEGLEEPA